MQSRIAIILTAAVGTTLAQGAFPNKNQALFARETDAGLVSEVPTSCSSAILSLVSEIPMPPEVLVTNSDIVNTNGPCPESIPASLTAEMSTYASSLLSWFSENEGDLSSLFKECTIAGSVYGQAPLCASSFLASAVTTTGSSSIQTPASSDATTTTDTASSTATTTSSGNAVSTTSNGGAAQETGARFAVAAVAGIIAAAM